MRQSTVIVAGIIGTLLAKGHPAVAESSRPTELSSGNALAGPSNAVNAPPTGAEITWSEISYSFGQVEFGQHPSHEFTLTNSTSTAQALTVYSDSGHVSFAGPGCQSTPESGYCDVVVPANEFIAITVTLDATAFNVNTNLTATNYGNIATSVYMDAIMYGGLQPEDLVVDLGNGWMQPAFGQGAFGEETGGIIKNLTIVPTEGTPASVFTMTVTDAVGPCPTGSTTCDEIGVAQVYVGLACRAPAGAVVGDTYSAMLTAQRQNVSGGPITPAYEVSLICRADQVVPQYSSSAPEQVFVCQGEEAVNELSIRLPAADNGLVLYSAGPPELAEPSQAFTLFYTGGASGLLGGGKGQSNNVYPGGRDSATLVFAAGAPVGNYEANVIWPWQNAATHTFDWKVDVLAPGIHVNGAESITVDFGEVLIGETAARRVQLNGCAIGDYQLVNDASEPGFAVTPAAVSFDDGTAQEVLVLFQPTQTEDYGSQANGITYSYIDGENVKHTVTINVQGRGIGGTDSEASYYACSTSGKNGGALPLMIVIGGLLVFRRRRPQN